jgi:hypothetical protein
MRAGLQLDVPPRAAAVIIAMALLSTLVTGRETPPQASPPPPADRVAHTKAASEPELRSDELMSRARASDAMPDLFATQSWAPPSPPAARAPEPAAARIAPALPFRYVGRIVQGDRTIAFLVRDDVLLIAEAGSVLESDYRVERVGDSAVDFIYVPLGTRQTASLQE